MTSPDPVSEPNAYQRLLVGLVGDDHAEIQAATPPTWREPVAETGADLLTCPAMVRPSQCGKGIPW
jgi:hypothetical protein